MSECTIEQMLQNECKMIADDLKAISDWRLFRDADGNTFEADDMDEVEEAIACAFVGATVSR